MTKYHINPETGRPNQCKAKTPQSCKFYTPENGVPPHFDSKEDARSHYEKSREDDTFGETLKKGGSTESIGISAISDHARPKVGDLTHILPEHEHDRAKLNVSVVDDYGEIDDSLGIYQAKVKGKAVGPMRYCEIQNAGIINYKNLDKRSYRKFGFPARNADRAQIEKDNSANFSMAQSATTPDFKKIDPGALALMKCYTEENGSISLHLIENTEEDDKEQVYCDTLMIKEDGTKNYIDDDYNGEEDDDDYYYDEDENWKSASTKDFIRSMDYVLNESSNGFQKITYRGVADSYSPPEGVKSWSEVPLGQEIRFDNFASTSANYSTASEFSINSSNGRRNEKDNNHIIFEIKSGSAVNVSAVSEYEDENEYILPRSSRFMVVGKTEGSLGDSRRVNNGSNDSLYKKPVDIIQLVEINEGGEIVDHNNIKRTQQLRKEYINKHSHTKQA